MNEYDWKKCVHEGKGGVFKRNKKCSSCVIDTKDMSKKPTNFKSKWGR